MKTSPPIDDPRYVKAMQHPLRVRILAQLDEGKASPNELAQRLNASLGTVAYHVRTLQDLGMIDLVDEQRVRGAVEHFYHARPRPTLTADDWKNAPPVNKQSVIASALQVINEYSVAAAAAGGFDNPHALIDRLHLQLDEKGFAAASAVLSKLYDRLDQIEGQSRRRMEKANGNAQPIQVAVGTLLFESTRLSDARPT